MLRSSRSEVCARTHTWLGPLRGDVICRIRSPVSCPHCAYHLQVLCGATVHLKHWMEAWRIRCTICGRILAQAGEGAFARELRWALVRGDHHGRGSRLSHRRECDRETAEAEYARHLLRVWLESRRVQGHATLRPRERRSGLSPKIDVNSRLMPSQSQIKEETRHPALMQSQS
jgi:hypothetical protein